MEYNLLLGALGLLIGVSALLVYLIAAHQHRLKLLNQGITIYYGENIRKPFRSISITYYLIYLNINGSYRKFLKKINDEKN